MLGVYHSLQVLDRHPLPLPQDQYEFIYSALLEACQFGDTLVKGSELGLYLQWLEGEGSSGTELSKQFGVRRDMGW